MEAEITKTKTPEPSLEIPKFKPGQHAYLPLESAVTFLQLELCGFILGLYLIQPMTTEQSVSKMQVT